EQENTRICSRRVHTVAVMCAPPSLHGSGDSRGKRRYPGNRHLRGGFCARCAVGGTAGAARGTGVASVLPGGGRPPGLLRWGGVEHARCPGMGVTALLPSLSALSAPGGRYAATRTAEGAGGGWGSARAGSDQSRFGPADSTPTPGIGTVPRLRRKTSRRWRQRLRLWGCFSTGGGRCRAGRRTGERPLGGGDGPHKRPSGSVGPSTGLPHLAIDGPGVGDRSEVGEFARVDHSADGLDLSVE